MTRAYNTATTQQNTGGAVSPVVAGKNVLINGAFDIWQRGTSFASGFASPYFIADRWQATRGGNVAGATMSRQTSGVTTGFQYYVRLQRDSGNTGTAGINLAQCIETSMAQPYASQTVTLSFYARAGATYNSAASNVNVYIYTGTGTDQNNFSAAYTGVATALNSTASVTTSWQRFSYTVTLASTVTEFEPVIVTQHSGTAGATDYIDVTGVQIELGSVATPFSRSSGTIQGELVAAQRYYYRISATNSPLSICEMRTTTTAGIVVPMPTTMRTSPTLDASSGTNYFIAKVTNTNHNISGAWTLDIASPTASELFATTGTTATAGNAGFVYLNNASAYLGFSAEL